MDMSKKPSYRSHEEKAEENTEAPAIMNAPEGVSIAVSAKQCLDSFQECLLHSSSLHARETSVVEGLIARFSTWANSMGVFAPQRASMDHRLRYAPDVRGVVDGLLESLKYRVCKCSEIMATMEKSMASNSTHVEREHLNQAFIQIGTEISHLNKLSNTIRKSSQDTQLPKARDFQLKDDEGNDVEHLLLSIYERHIGDRFPHISENIQQRLARAMILRRKRILYRRHRQGFLGEVSPTSVPVQNPNPELVVNTFSKEIHSNAIPNQTLAFSPSTIQSATTLHPEKFKSAPLSLSVISESKTIPLKNHESLVWPSAPGLAVKENYEKIKMRPEIHQEAAQKSIAAPHQFSLKPHRLDRSDFDKMGEITCPYCLHALPAEIVFTEHKWINHVKHDLDPYVCLFEECHDPDVIYGHSNEWWGHMKQHYTFWRCPSHRDLGSFFTSEDYIAHVQENHKLALSDAQLRTMAKLNSRTRLPPLCNLCKQEDYAVEGSLEAHISGHLRSLAIKSLPSYQERFPDNIGDDEDSTHVSTKKTRSIIMDSAEHDINALDMEDLALVEQVERSNMHNFLGDPYLDLGNNPQMDWDASFYERLAYENLSWDPTADTTFQSLLENKKQESAITRHKQAARDQIEAERTVDEERRERETGIAAAAEAVAEAAAKAKLEAAMKAKEEAEKAAEKKMKEEAERRELVQTEAENELRAKIAEARVVMSQSSQKENVSAQGVYLAPDTEGRSSRSSNSQSRSGTNTEAPIFMPTYRGKKQTYLWQCCHCHGAWQTVGLNDYCSECQRKQCSACEYMPVKVKMNR